MSLITLDELARGACIGVFGGLAGLTAYTLAPGTPLWLLPAAAAVGGSALTVPEVRQELARYVPMLAEGSQRARAALPHVAWQLPGVKQERRPSGKRSSPQERVRGAAPAEERPELLTTLDEQPHRLIIGHSRGGKTTLIHELATGWARDGARVLVGDPDAAPGLWPGCEVRGYGDDVESIGELLTVVSAEVEARRMARAQGVRRFEPLHLVIDEAHDVLPVLEGGLELFEDVARRGGKLNIRMTVGVQDKQVKTLGLEGKSALLRNFCTADVMKNREGRRVAVLRDPETGQKVSMAIPQLTDPESLIITRPATETTQNLRRSPVPVSNPAPADSLLASLLGQVAQAPRPSLDERIAAVLGAATIESADGHTTVHVYPASPAVVTAPTPPVAPRRERKRLTLAELNARRAWARYYQRAARRDIPFDRAYKAAPVKGNRNHAHAIYKAAKGVETPR